MAKPSWHQEANPEIPKEQQIQTSSKGKPSDDDRSDGAPVLRAVMEVPQPVIDEFTRQYEQENRREKIKIGLEVLTVVGIFFYATIAAFQWGAMLRADKEATISANAAVTAAGVAQQALQNTRDTFRRDQRPYMWLANTMVGPAYDTTRKEIVWNWYLTNYGKTPAYKLKGREFMKVGTGLFKPSSLHSDITFPPVPPNKVGEFDTVFSESGVTPKEVQAYMQMDGGIQIRVDISYSDSYGGQYYTGFCFSHNANGSVQYCDNTYMK